MPLCGLCLRPSPLCQFFLKKGKGARASLIVNQAISKGCLMKLKYSYGVASESTTSSPCSNVPIHCPLCPKSDPAIWRYFFKVHFQQKHPNAPFAQYENIWKLTNFEITEMKRIWANRMKVTVKRTKKLKLQPLTISEDHRAQIPATRYFISIIILVEGLNLQVNNTSDDVPILQDNSSGPTSGSESESDSQDSSESDSEDSSESGASTNDCGGVAEVHEEEAARWSCNGDSSAGDKFDVGLNGRCSSGEVETAVHVRNSKGVATVIDKESSNIVSVSVQQNIEKNRCLQRSAGK